MSAPSNVSLFRWEVVDFFEQREDAEWNHLTSTLFTLSNRQSVKFEMFIQYGNFTRGQNDFRVILKQVDDKPVETNVRLWIEHTSGQKFGETFVENHVFSKIDDFCGFKGQSDNEWTTFWRLYHSRETFFFCCEMVDLNGRTTSINDRDQKFRQNQLSFYERMHDAVIKVGETEFKIFKFVFMCQSEVFERMFLSNFTEGVTSEIKIEDIDEDTMKHFVKWFYTGKLENDSPIEKLFTAADKYDVKLLKETCADRMLSTLDKKNAFDRLILASMHSDTQFKEDVLDFISGLPSVDFANFFTSGEWHEFYNKNPGAAKDVEKFIRDKMNA